MSDGVCDTTDRYGGNPPCVWTMCKGQCEGMGFVPNEHADGGWKLDECPDCGGTGKRVKGPLAALLELAEGVAGPLHFAAFWWREYGFFAADWQESWSSDSAISAFRMTWRDKRDQRIGARREIMRSVFSRWY
jgi:hypothetical protein